MCSTAILFGDALAKYGFDEPHPWKSNRIYSFWSKFSTLVHPEQNSRLLLVEPELASEDVLMLFHDKDYVDLVKKSSKHGNGFLDSGDTPAFKHVFEASSYVVGSTLKALDLIMNKSNGIEHSFNPIGGLHHARRDSAGGFCVFNDIGIAILVARNKYGIKRIAYVDIDAHHGDGVYYEFENDPLLFFADIHENGRFLYPGTGSKSENGIGEAKGTKLNIPVDPYSTDEVFFKAFNRIEEFIDKIAKPELIILQCGADCLKGDPITHLSYTERIHRYAADSLHKLAHKHSNGRIVALGGGGYNAINIGNAWTEIVKSLANSNTD